VTSKLEKWNATFGSPEKSKEGKAIWAFVCVFKKLLSGLGCEWGGRTMGHSDSQGDPTR
jgi:hypothetical protein